MTIKRERLRELVFERELAVVEVVPTKNDGKATSEMDWA
jgi:hypothetical protein